MSGERTEAATPKRLSELRGQGRSPRSQELGSTVGLLVGCIVLQNAAAGAAGRLQGLLAGQFNSLAYVDKTQDVDLLWAQQMFGRAGEAWFFSVLPLLLILPA